MRSMHFLSCRILHYDLVNDKFMPRDAESACVVRHAVQ